MFIICAPAMLMLHEALQKLLQVFFENFQSDFSAPKVTSSLQICDVDHNRDILQLKVAALYKLHPIWVDTYVCGYCIFIYLYMHAQTQFTRSSMNVNHIVDIYWILPCFIVPLLLVTSRSLFRVSWRTSEGSSATVEFVKISALPCLTETQSSVTACKI